MAITVKPEPVEFDLTDYFSKWGFGDGDDGVLQDLAYKNRERVIRLLNEEFKKAGLPIKADEAGGGSIHNNCRIQMIRTDLEGDDDECSIDWDYNQDKSLAGLNKKKFAAALAAVEQRLHAKFQSQENRGTYRPKDAT